LTDFEKKLIKKWIKNSNVNKWYVEWEGQYLIYADANFSIDDCPNMGKYLSSHKKELEKRTGKSYGWERLHRPRILHIFESKKILVPYKAKTLRFALDTNNYFCSADVYIINMKSETNDIPIEFIIGLLNSKLIEFWIKKHAKRLGEQFEFYPYMLSRIPIKLPKNGNDKKLVEDITKTVSEIIKNLDDFNLVQKLEDKLNNLVFKYYGITDKEKLIMENICKKY
jgi:hypothetical protein